MREAQTTEERLTAKAATGYARSMAIDGHQEQEVLIPRAVEKRGWFGRRKQVVSKKEEAAKQITAEKKTSGAQEGKERKPLEGKLTIFDAFSNIFKVKIDHISDNNLEKRAIGLAMLAEGNFTGTDKQQLAKLFVAWDTAQNSSFEEKDVSAWAQKVILQAANDRNIKDEEFGAVVNQIRAGIPLLAEQKDTTVVVPTAEHAIDLGSLPPELDPLVEKVVTLVVLVDDDEKRKELSTAELKATYKELLPPQRGVGISKEEDILRKIGRAAVLQAVADKGESTQAFQVSVHDEVFRAEGTRAVPTKRYDPAVQPTPAPLLPQDAQRERGVYEAYLESTTKAQHSANVDAKLAGIQGGGQVQEPAAQDFEQRRTEQQTEEWKKKGASEHGEVVAAARTGSLPRVEEGSPFSEVFSKINEQVGGVLNRREVTEKRIRALRRAIEESPTEGDLLGIIDGQLKNEWRILAEIDAQLSIPDSKDPAGMPMVEARRNTFIANRELLFDDPTDPTAMTSKKGILDGNGGTDTGRGLSDLKRRADKLADTIRLNEAFRYSKSEQDRPTLNNFNDLCEEIAKTNSDYATGGNYELIDKNGVIKEENFIRWIRDRISWHHGNSPDTPLEFARIIDIGKENSELWRFLTLGQILESPKQYFKKINPNGTETDMHDLYLEVTNYMWLIPKLRNMETQFRTIMWDSENAMKALDQLFAGNDFTKLGLGGKTTLETIFTMAERFAHIDEKDPDTRDVTLGDMIGEAFLMYYNITDIKYLQKEFGDLNFFLTKDGLERAIYSQLAGTDRTDSKTDDAQKIENFKNPRDEHGNIDVGKQGENHLMYVQFLKNAELEKWEQFFDASGKLINDPTLQMKFLKILNPFDPIQKNQDQLNVVKKLVQQGAAERAGMLKKPVLNGRNSAEVRWGKMDPASGFGEMMGFLMCYPFGAAAKAEMSIKGANSMVNPYYIKFKKDKMESESKAGNSGGLYTHGLVLSSFTDFVTGLKSVGGDTIIEILEKKHKVLKAGHGNQLNTTVEVDGKVVTLEGDIHETPEQRRTRLDELRKRIAKTARFDRNDSQGLAGVGWKNQFKIAELEFSGEEMNFDKFVSIGLHGTKYDVVGMQKEIKSKWIDPYRKGWDTNKVPFDVLVDACTDNKPESGPFVYEKITHAERMLGPQVLEVAQKIWIHEVNNPFNKDLRELRKAGRGVRFLDSHGAVIKNPDGTLPDYVKEILSHDEFNRIAVKATLLTRAAAEMFSHTTVHGDSQHMSWANRVKAKGGLAHISAGRDTDAHNFQHSHQTDYYFRKFDMQLFEEMSDNTFWKNFFRETGKDSVGGIFSGIFGAFKELFKAVGQ